MPESKVYCPSCRGVFGVPPGAPADAVMPCPHCGRWVELEARPVRTSLSAETLAPYPEGIPIPETDARCWKCGNRVPNDQAVRRDVRTGVLAGLFGGLISIGGWGVAGQWSRVDFCPACAAALDATRARLWYWAKRVAVVLAALWLIGAAFELLTAHPFRRW